MLCCNSAQSWLELSWSRIRPGHSKGGLCLRRKSFEKGITCFDETSNALSPKATSKEPSDGNQCLSRACNHEAIAVPSSRGKLAPLTQIDCLGASKSIGRLSVALVQRRVSFCSRRPSRCLFSVLDVRFSLFSGFQVIWPRLARCSPGQRSRLAFVSTHCTTRAWLDRVQGLRPRRFQSLHWQGTHFPCSRGRDHGGTRKSLLRHHLRIVRSCLITHRECLISAHAPEISQLEVLWVFFSALFLTALVSYATTSLPVPSNYALDVGAFQCLSTSPSPCSMASLLPSSRRLRVMTLAHLFHRFSNSILSVARHKCEVVCMPQFVVEVCVLIS